MATTQQQPTHLEPSKLGTREYWDALYTSEISNHAADPSDTGTVWFDDSDAESKLVSFLSSRATNTTTTTTSLPSTSSASAESRLPRNTTTFLDLGCGNGSLLLALRSARWRGTMLGVDYSAQSVALAQRIAADPPERDQDDSDDSDDDDDDDDDDDGKDSTGGNENENDAGTVVHHPPPPSFLEWDIIGGAFSPVLEHAGQPAGWDVVLDKGTFDAVSLSADRDADGRRISERYRERVLRLVKPGGLFLITSCNWTEAELESWFAKGSDDATATNGGHGAFAVDGRVEYKSFSFGGVKGQTISTMCFKKSD